MAPPKSKSTKKASETGTEWLDVEEDDARQKRLQSLLEHLSAPSTHPATTVPVFPSPPTGLPKFDFGDRRTEAVVPNTELLSRVQAFLPQLEASNRELLARAKVDPKSVDIENVETKDGRIIEMNLGLGVFEEKQKHNKAAAGTKNAPIAGATTSSDAPPLTKAGVDDEEMASSSSSGSSSSPSDDSDSDSSGDDSDSTCSSSSSTSSSSSSSQAEDQGPNDPLTNFFASLGSALDSATSSSSPHSDSDSDSDGDGEDEDPLTTFFDSLRYGQTISMDSSDEESEEDEAGGGDSGEGESDEEGGSRKEGRPTKPLPKRARPRIEVVGDEAPSGADAAMGGTAGQEES